MKTYEGSFAGPGRRPAVWVIGENGERAMLEPRAEVQHYAMRFAWGVGGAPTTRQLAFAVLYDVFRDRHRALDLTDRFRDHVFAAIPSDSEWSLTDDAIRHIAHAMQTHGMRTGTESNPYARPLEEARLHA